MNSPIPPSSSASGPRLGWIGLGSMGLGMATSLQKRQVEKQAPSLLFYNRTESRGATLQEIGGIPRSISDLVANSDIIFMSLSDGTAVSMVLDKIIDTCQTPSSLEGKIIVDTSTIQPDMSVKMRMRLQEKGADYVAAPVIGAAPIAAKGQLLWLLAGAEPSIEKVRPYIIGAMGRDIILLGEDVRHASVLKSVANSLMIGTIEVVGEAHVFAERSGLRPETVEALIKQIEPLGYLISQRLTSGAYMPPRGERPWADVNLAVATGRQALTSAQENGLEMAVASLIMRHLEEAKKFGDAEGRQLDVAAIYGAIRKNSGLPFETDFVKKRDSSA